MQFLDDSLLPENQQPLVIQVAPYGPEFLPGDSDDIPVTMDEQVQKAVDCWNAGATVLHVHCREADGKGSKRLSMFNELLDRLRSAVPKMVLQVGGSISFAPEGEGADAKWLSDDTRHMLAELDPKPDQVTIAINTNQMNVCELLTADDVAGTSLALPAYQAAYSEMTFTAGPAFVAEHLKRLQAAGIQPHFMLGDAGQLETVERLIRRGVYTGPLVLNHVMIGGGADGPNPYNMMEFIRRVPAGAVLTIEGLMRNVLPLNTMAIAMGLHVRVGIEDNLWGKKGERLSSVKQIEQTVRIARELYREVATGEQAKQHLPDRHAIQERRRDAGQARLRPEPPCRRTRLAAAPGRLIDLTPCPIRLSCQGALMAATIPLIALAAARRPRPAGLQGRARPGAVQGRRCGLRDRGQLPAQRRLAEQRQGAGHAVTCPVHGLTFSLEGVCPPGPARLEARTFAVHVEDGMVMLTADDPSPQDPHKLPTA